MVASPPPEGYNLTTEENPSTFPSEEVTDEIETDLTARATCAGGSSSPRGGRSLSLRRYVHHWEKIMHNPILIRDPNLRRLVRDFDALADVLQTLIDRDHQPSSHNETVPEHDMEFTTEWQMESTAEEELRSAIRPSAIGQAETEG
jgi:hypothetical protein